MNLAKLFDMQQKLDDHIMDEHPELKGQNNLDWKILSLQVELGECANEWRGFKKWSNDQEPRTKVVHRESYDKPPYYRNLVLEEYVDCLHFILSIGLEIGADKWMEIEEYPQAYDNGGIILQFLDVNSRFLELMEEIIRMDLFPKEIRWLYIHAFESFLQLGTKLGFTWEQIEQAYFAKNAVNHQRQENGY